MARKKGKIPTKYYFSDVYLGGACCLKKRWVEEGVVCVCGGGGRWHRHRKEEERFYVSLVIFFCRHKTLEKGGSALEKKGHTERITQPSRSSSTRSRATSEKFRGWVGLSASISRPGWIFKRINASAFFFFFFLKPPFAASFHHLALRLLFGRSIYSEKKICRRLIQDFHFHLQ